MLRLDWAYCSVPENMSKFDFASYLISETLELGDFNREDWRMKVLQKWHFDIARDSPESYFIINDKSSFTHEIVNCLINVENRMDLDGFKKRGEHWSKVIDTAWDGSPISQQRIFYVRLGDILSAYERYLDKKYTFVGDWDVMQKMQLSRFSQTGEDLSSDMSLLDIQRAGKKTLATKNNQFHSYFGN